MTHRTMTLGSSAVGAAENGWIDGLRSLLSPFPALEVTRQSLAVEDASTRAVLACSSSDTAGTSPECGTRSGYVKITRAVQEDDLAPLPEVVFTLSSSLPRDRAVTVTWSFSYKGDGILILSEAEGTIAHHLRYNLYFCADGRERPAQVLREQISLRLAPSAAVKISFTFHFHVSFGAANGFSGQCVVLPQCHTPNTALALLQRMTRWPKLRPARPLHKYLTPVFVVPSAPRPESGATPEEFARRLGQIPFLRRLFLPTSPWTDALGQCLEAGGRVRVLRYCPDEPGSLTDAFVQEGLPMLPDPVVRWARRQDQLPVEGMAYGRYLGKELGDLVGAPSATGPAIEGAFISAYAQDVRAYQEQVARSDSSVADRQQLLDEIEKVTARLPERYHSVIRGLQAAPANLVITTADDDDPASTVAACSFAAATGSVVANVRAGPAVEAGERILEGIDEIVQSARQTPGRPATDEWADHADLLQRLGGHLKHWLPDRVTSLIEEQLSPESVVLFGSRADALPLELIGWRRADWASFWGAELNISRVPPLSGSGQMLYVADMLASRKAASSGTTRTALLVFVRDTRVGGLPPLLMADRERELAKATLEESGFSVVTLCSQDGSASLAGLVAHASEADLIYICCHARLSTEGGELALQDQMVTASRLGQELRLRGRPTIVLSCCQSARVGLHAEGSLAAALAEAGAGHCFGTLWGLADADAPVLAPWLLRRLCRGEVGSALRTAKHDALMHAAHSPLSFLGFAHFGDPTDRQVFDPWAAFLPAGERALLKATELAVLSFHQGDFEEAELLVTLGQLHQRLSGSELDPVRSAYLRARVWEARALRHGNASLLAGVLT